MNDPNKISVVPYNPIWAAQYKEESTRIKDALGDNLVAIHHVGSTAVEGLPSKPKIDIIGEVKNLHFSHAGLEKLGYAYRGGFNLPLRRSFTLRRKELDVNLHIFEEGDPEVELNLLFRDYLRENASCRKDYADLKYRLVEEEGSHRKANSMFRGYNLGKAEFIQDILRQTGFNRLRFVIATHYNEIEAVKKHSKEATFDDPNHQHFILYRGVEIIGYAYIQILSDKKITLHMLVAEDSETRQAFIDLIQKWVDLEGFLTGEGF